MAGSRSSSLKSSFPYNKFLDERRVIVRTPSRIHITLLDMNGGLGRVDGGIGITLDAPSILLEAQASPSLEVHGCDRRTRHWSGIVQKACSPGSMRGGACRSRCGNTSRPTSALGAVPRSRLPRPGPAWSCTGRPSPRRNWPGLSAVAVRPASARPHSTTGVSSSMAGTGSGRAAKKLALPRPPRQKAFSRRRSLCGTNSPATGASCLRSRHSWKGQAERGSRDIPDLLPGPG